MPGGDDIESGEDLSSELRQISRDRKAEVSP